MLANNKPLIITLWNINVICIRVSVIPMWCSCYIICTLYRFGYIVIISVFIYSIVFYIDILSKYVRRISVDLHVNYASLKASSVTYCVCCYIIYSYTHAHMYTCTISKAKAKSLGSMAVMLNTCITAQWISTRMPVHSSLMEASFCGAGLGACRRSHRGIYRCCRTKSSTTMVGHLLSQLIYGYLLMLQLDGLFSWLEPGTCYTTPPNTRTYTHP